jgi:spoIIIJ-associated protein
LSDADTPGTPATPPADPLSGAPTTPSRDPQDRAAPAADRDTEAEGTGETVGEAKWAALRELERRFPGIDKANIRFAVVSEGERGLLGVGFAPARVIATVAGTPPARAVTLDSTPAYEPGSPAARLHELVTRVAAALGVPISVSVSEDDSTLVARLSGADLGLLIGRHGQTIDAIQYLANAILWRGASERKDVVVDAAGYRERRRASLERVADRAVRDAARSGEAVALEPMTAVERKLVHVYLKDRSGIETSSEGTEPNRHVVIRPVAQV